MRQSQRTRIARLENRINHYVAQRAEARALDSRFDDDGYLASDLVERLLAHAVNLAYLTTFGDPKIGEPLIDAWKRTGYNGKYNPFEAFGAEMVSNDLRSTVFPDLPGNSLKEKLDLIFETAPGWLIWFTSAEVTAHMLHLKLPPDFLSFVEFARPPASWWALPSDAFECEPWPDGSLPNWAIGQIAGYLMRKAGLIDTRMSRRQRARRIDLESPPEKFPIRWPER